MKGEKAIVATMFNIAKDPQGHYNMTILSKTETVQVYVSDELWKTLGETAGWFAAQKGT